MGFLDKVRNGLKKTKESLIKNIETVVIGYAKIDDDFLEDLEMVLLSGDLGVRTTDYLMRQIRRGVTEGMISSTNEVMPFMEKTVVSMLTEDGKEDISHHPEVYLVVGVNGVGKTTTIGKLSAQFRKEGKKALLAAADTFRAAASEQLSIWAERTGADIVKHAEGADPAVSPDAPHQTILVLDATTGQNAVSQAQNFGEIVPLTGVVLTKLDGTAKGGVVLSIHEELHVPIRWIGLGEREDDLQRFNALEFAKALFETEDHILSQSTKV